MLEQAVAAYQSALEVYTKADLPQVGPGPRTIWASRFGIWERAVGEKKAASCLRKPWLLINALWRSGRKPICLRIGP